MLDMFPNEQQDQLSPAQGTMAPQAAATAGQAYAATREANVRTERYGAEFYNQQDFLRGRMDDFTKRTGEALPALQVDDSDTSTSNYDQAYRGWLDASRAKMTAVSQARNDPTLLPPSDQDIAAGGLQLARGALRQQAQLASGVVGPGAMLGTAGAGGVDMARQTIDPSNPLNALALGIGPEGGALATALRMGGAMGAAQLYGDVQRYGYRQQIDPSYGARDVAADVAGAAAGGALFGLGHVVGGEGIRGTLGAAVGGAVGGGVLGGLQGGGPGAIEGAVGGAAVPLAGAGLGATSRVLGASWRAMVAAKPELAASMPLEVRDAGTVAEKQGDLDAQNPYAGPSGVAAHGEAVAKIESDLLQGRSPELPPAAQAESQARRGQVFFPGGAIDARYGVVEHSDLVTSHDADFAVNPAYPPELQPRDRASAPARDQVTNMAGNLEPERLGPSVEANAGAPIVGPDGVVESGNGRTIAIGQAYDTDRGDAYRSWLEQQGFDTSGMEKPVLVGMRETPLDDAGRAAFAHATNGSAALRMSATEQALSDARLLDSPTLDLHAGADLSTAANRDFARAIVAKLPQGERGGMLTREGGLSAGGAARVRNALTARAYGDPAFLSRALDHPDPNIKAIAGALGDAAGSWARMRDAATRGDIEGGHDITGDVLQAVHAIMRARDEGRPAWEVLNQGDIFQSDTTQLAARMFFRDEEMRQAAGRGRIADALAGYAEEAAKNTKAGRLFADNVGVGDVLRRVVAKVMPGAPDDFVLASIRKIEERRGDASPGRLRWVEDEGDYHLYDLDGDHENPLASVAQLTDGTYRVFVGGEQVDAASLDDAQALAAKAASRQPSFDATEPAALSTKPVRHTIFEPGDVRFADDLQGRDFSGIRRRDWEGSEHAHEGNLYDYHVARIKDGNRIHSVVRNIDFEDEDSNRIRAADALTKVQMYKLKKSLVAHEKEILETIAEEETGKSEWANMSGAEQRAELAKQERERQSAIDERRGRVNSAVDDLVSTGWRPTVDRFGNWARPEAIREFASPSSNDMIHARLAHHGIDIAGAERSARASGEDVVASVRRSPAELTASLDTGAQDALAMARPGDEDVAARARSESEVIEPAADAQPDLTLRNGRTGAEVQAQEATPLDDMLKRFDEARDGAADPLARATRMVVGDRLSKIIGDMKVYTVGPEEMRTLTASRLNLASGYEAAGFYDRAGHIVVLDDVARNSAEMSRLLAHEGMHAAFMKTIENSEAATNVIDHLRDTAAAAHAAAGGDLADHYGLKNAHEFISEAFSNPEFQRFLASIPADDRTVAAFGLDRAPGYSLWDTFAAAVRKILGFAPDQHTLLDATMRVGKLLEEMRQGNERGSADDVAASLRLQDPDERRAAAQEAASKARAFSDAKAAISYRINTDRIAQHPNGPLAGFLGILTRDIHEKGGINVESVQQGYEGRMAEASEHILEPYGSKWAGLKQDVAGIREMIHELFGVDTKNETAKTAAHAWKAGVDTFATEEAKRLGKVFSPAEDWRVPQFWESSRAQKFGRAELIADLDREVQGGGLKVYDSASGQEANPIQRRIILDEAATKITTDASMGSGPGTGSGAFKTDMRVFRFAEGREGADAYMRMMDKYGAGRGGYLRMMQAHVGKVSRELGLMRVLGPDWNKTGQQLLDDAQSAHRTTEALRPPRTLAERLRDLPGDAGKFAIGWLESPTKAEAVWQYMSGQSSGVGSELMAGMLSGTRAFLTATRMGSAIVTAVPADTVNWLMAAKHNGMDMGRMVSSISDAFLRDSPEKREEAARLGIVAHAGVDAALGTKRFADQFVGEKLMKRMADFVIRAQGLHAWDSAIKRAFPMEMFGTIAQRAGKSFDELDEPFARFLDRFGFDRKDWAQMSDPANHADLGSARYLLPDKLPEALGTRLRSAVYDERQFAYLAGGSARVSAISASAKAGTLPGEVARSVMLFKSFPMSMLATWGVRSAREASQGRIGTLAALVTGMTFAGALAMQARALLQGKDPRSMRDPFFWGESFLQGGAAGIYGDFFKEAFSRSDTSLTESLMGPLAAIPAGIQGLTSGARRLAEDGEKVNFGAKLSRLISQNTPGGNLWYTRLLASRLLFDNIQRMLDRDHDAAFARQQRRAMKTDHQGFYWAPGSNAPGRAPDFGAAVQ